jgi:hypothetical protein
MEICVINWAGQLVKAVCAVREMSADDGTSENDSEAHAGLRYARSGH